MESQRKRKFKERFVEKLRYSEIGNESEKDIDREQDKIHRKMD